MAIVISAVSPQEVVKSLKGAIEQEAYFVVKWSLKASNDLRADKDLMMAPSLTELTSLYCGNRDIRDAKTYRTILGRMLVSATGATDDGGRFMGQAPAKDEPLPPLSPVTVELETRVQSSGLIPLSYTVKKLDEPVDGIEVFIYTDLSMPQALALLLSQPALLYHRSLIVYCPEGLYLRLDEKGPHLCLDEDSANMPELSAEGAEVKEAAEVVSAEPEVAGEATSLPAIEEPEALSNDGQRSLFE